MKTKTSTRGKFKKRQHQDVNEKVRSETQTICMGWNFTFYIHCLQLFRGSRSLWFMRCATFQLQQNISISFTADIFRRWNLRRVGWPDKRLIGTMEIWFVDTKHRMLTDKFYFCLLILSFMVDGLKLVKTWNIWRRCRRLLCYAKCFAVSSEEKSIVIYDVFSPDD